MEVENLIDYARRRAEEADALLSEISRSRGVACSRGCVYCCYGVTLWVRKIEALLIAHSLNRKKIKDRRDIAQRLRRYASIYERESRKVGYRPRSPQREEELDTERLGVVGGLAMNEVPCPLLAEDGSCEVYPERPLMCRLTLFKDSDVCRRDWENPLLFLWSDRIAPFVEEVKAEFLPRFRRRLEEIGGGVEDPWEREVVFITDYIRYDPLKKVFYVKEGGEKLVP
jgi:Fe-S-cluster containining protein